MKHYIPYTDNGNKTQRYTIRLDDAIEFIISFEQSPERFAASNGEFSSKQYIIPTVDKSVMRETLEKMWSDVPELLDTITVSRLTGYSDNAVNHWLEKGTMRSAVTQNGRVTSKEWLIEYLCGEGMRIARKNEWHLKILKAAAKKTVRSDTDSLKE